MRRIKTIIIVAAALIWVAACDHKDDLSLGPSDLVQTTWSGMDYVYDEGVEIASENFILEFLTSSTGTYIYMLMIMVIPMVKAILSIT